MNLTINQYSQYSRFVPSFKSKSPDIKRADDALRQSKQNFEAFSPNYARFYYSCANNVNSKNYKRANEIITNERKKFVHNVRQDNKKDLSVEKSLENVKKYKQAHCYERALTVAAQLYSMGYNHLFIASMLCNFEIENKETGKLYFYSKPLKHATVVTDMNNKNRAKDIDKLIVVDSWLDFAKIFENAKVEYKNAFKKDIEKMKKDAIFELSQKYGAGDYEIRSVDFDMDKLKLSKEDTNVLKNYFGQ